MGTAMIATGGIGCELGMELLQLQVRQNASSVAQSFEDENDDEHEDECSIA
jgi:hypothetical protein